MFSQIKDWEFMSEPLWRWFIFLAALIIMMMVWGTVLAYMKD